MSYVRLTKPYTRPCNLFKTFSHLVTTANSFIIIHSLHQWRPVGAGLFLVGPQPQLQPQLQFLLAKAAGRSSQIKTTWTIHDRAFEPTMPTPTLQEWPRTQKQPSMMSAIICACIKGLLPISTATSLCLAKYITFNLI